MRTKGFTLLALAFALFLAGSYAPLALADGNGCVRVYVEAVTSRDEALRPAPQFTVRLDGGRMAWTDGDGSARFDDVATGTRGVSLDLPFGWSIAGADPSRGTVNVYDNASCAEVRYRVEQRRVSPWSMQLSITRIDGRDRVRPGDVLTYRIVVRNPTNFQAYGLMLRDTIPQTLSLLSASPQADTDGSVVSWGEFGLQPGEARSYTIRAQVTNAAAGWYATNTVRLEDGASASDAVFVERPEPAPSPVPALPAPLPASGWSAPARLQLQLLERPDPVALCGELQYLVRVRNADASAGDTFTDVTLSLPSAVRAVSAFANGSISGDTVTWRAVRLSGTSETRLFVSTRVTCTAPANAGLAAVASAGSVQASQFTRILSGGSSVPTPTLPPQTGTSHARPLEDTSAFVQVR